MRRWLQFIFLLCLASAGPRAHGAEIRTSEYELKAAFLFNFTQFVDWPTNAFETDSSPIIIGVLGPDPFGDTLDRLAAGEEVRGRKLKIERYARLADSKAAHLLFISRVLNTQWPDIERELAGRPILTVSDMDRFAARGGMIHLVTERNLVRMRVNTDAAKRCQIVISSKLLRLADNAARGAGGFE